MSFLDLNNDLKSMISKHLSSDLSISKMLQKVLFGEIVFDDE